MIFSVFRNLNVIPGPFRLLKWLKCRWKTITPSSYLFHYIYIYRYILYIKIPKNLALSSPAILDFSLCQHRLLYSSLMSGLDNVLITLNYILNVCRFYDIIGVFISKNYINFKKTLFTLWNYVIIHTIHYVFFMYRT